MVTNHFNRNGGDQLPFLGAEALSEGSPFNVIEEDELSVLTVMMSIQYGQLDMLLTLPDCDAEYWNQVTVQQASKRLLQLYQPLLGGIARLALTSQDGRVGLAESFKKETHSKKLPKKAEQSAQAPVCCMAAQIDYSTASPYQALYKLLRQGSRRGHCATRVGDTILCGPSWYFDAQRHYWASLMNRDSGEAVLARSFAESEAPTLLTHLSDQEVKPLYETILAVKVWTSSGLDMWPPRAIKVLPWSATRALAWLFYTIEHSHRWTFPLLNVRVQLIPTTVDEKPTLQEHRPTSVTSRWCWVWSAWTLRRLPQETWQIIGPESCEGLAPRLLPCCDVRF